MREPAKPSAGHAHGSCVSGETWLDPTTCWAGGPAPQGWPGSVWVTGQVCSRDQRRGRYTRESMAHPAKMLPSIARYAIATYTTTGEWVLDPMAGIATTVVEAMHLGRRGIGVEYEPRWAELAAGNLRHATTQGATGTGQMFTGDSRHLPALVPAEARGRVSLVLTSPPYGSSTHGHVRTPGPRRGKVRKLHHRYGADAGNLAYQDHDELAAGFTQILAGCAAVLRPGGHVVVTARPYRRHGELVDIPGMVVAAGTNAGLRPHERCVALIAGIRDGRLVTRASFFQLKNLRAAIAAGDPQWLVQHEDILVFQAPGAGPGEPDTRASAPPMGSAGPHGVSGGAP
jgi:DNA methylase